MKIKSLFLENFRNYEKKEIFFSEGINVILGENGVGKTNILESIFSLSFTKPFRSQKKEVFIQHSKEYSRITGFFFSNTSSEKLEIFWGLTPKKINFYKKNGIKVSASEYIQEKFFLSVLFSPEEMNLPFLSPESCRKFLSRVLSPLFPEYFHSSLRYASVLVQRNSLLKRYSHGEVQKSEFFFWNTQLAFHHEILQKYRRKFFIFVNQKISEYYSAIAKIPEKVTLQFLESVSQEKNFLECLEKNFENDVRRGTTLLGSHRDDFSFLLRGIPVQEGASRGETRTMLLALKKCEQNFLEEFGKSSPLLLLDDVFSELDLFHQEHLLEIISNSQAIITSTELHCSIESIAGVKVHFLVN